MKIQTEILPDHHARLTVEVEPEVFEGYQRRAARKISRETKIPGFRPGKAPFDVIVRIVGLKTIAEEALELWVDDNYPKVLDEAKVEAGAPGKVADIPSFDPLTIVFLVPLEPTVKLGDYQAIRSEYQPPVVTEEQVQEVLHRIQFNMATAEPVENRPAETGDLVYYELSGTLTQPGESEAPDVYPRRNVQSIIGGSSMDADDWPYEGFSANLAGLSPDDEKSILHTFSQEEQDEALRGREVEFKIKVSSIKSLSLPEVNDELAQSAGNFDNLEALLADIRSRLEKSSAEQYDSEYYDGLLDRLVEEAEIEYPDEILDEEIEHLLEHLKGDLAQQNMDLETYLKLINTDMNTFIENEVKPAARNRISRTLVMEELGRQEKINLSDTDMDAVANEASYELYMMNQGAPARRPDQETMQAVTISAMTRIRNRRILERLKAIANNEVMDEAEELSTEAAAEVEEQTAPSSEPQNDDSSSS